VGFLLHIGPKPQFRRKVFESARQLKPSPMLPVSSNPIL
jgi:hypothetical protein